MDWDYAGLTFTGADFNALTLSMSGPATGNDFTATITITIPPFGQITVSSRFQSLFYRGMVDLFRDQYADLFHDRCDALYAALCGSSDALKDSSSDNLVTLYREQPGVVVDRGEDDRDLV